MVLRLYNTLTGEKEEFKPLEPGKVKIYTCGPTVYDFAHIGNFRTYIFQDLLRRWLKYKGYIVHQVMNITDVDDKTIRKAKEEGVPLKVVTERYTKAFFEDMEKLGIDRAEVYPKVTDHIREMVELIRKLMEKGYAYKGEDGSIYYNISKFKDYGRLSKLSLPKLRSGIKIKADQYKKEEAEDFAIWKAWDEGDGEVFWETELGKGRPGWHIECSTLSMKYLGGTLDIHSGGVDLIFPHHENEVAQSEAATGKKFVNYWIHCNHLIVEGKKMSKSLGNFYTLRDLLEKGYNPKTIRYVLLSTHYRKPLNFTFQNLESASHIISKLEEFVGTLNKVEWDEENPEIENLIAETRIGFEEAMDEDLNVNMALASIFQFIRKVNKFINEKRLSKKDAEKIYGFLKSIDEVLGIFGQPLEPRKLPEEAERLLLMREEARKRKDWKTADELRKKLEGMGLKIEDTSRGVQWMWKKES